MPKYNKNRPLPGEVYPHHPDQAHACTVCQLPTLNNEMGLEWIHKMCVNRKRMVVG